MGFLVLALVNIAVVVGGGELGDKVAEKVSKTGKQLNRIEKEVKKETKVNVNVSPVINFKPTIKVNPTIKSKNENENKNDNTSQLDFGNEGGLKKK